MTTFVMLAVLAALGSALYIARPLWREGARRGGAIALAVAIVAGSAAFYAWSSRWEWPAVDAATTPTAMVGQLARRLEREPGDVEGWLMLGRSQIALGQYPLAVRAFQRADRLEGGRNAEAVLGIAEALMSQADSRMDERTGRLFERALELAPDSGRALFFAAIAAQNRGENALAIGRFDRLLALQPPPEVRSIIEAQVAALRDGAPRAAGPGTSASTAAAPGTSASPAARVTVAVSVAAQLADRVTPGATVFVFVRASGRPGPPLAAKRLPAVFPMKVELTPEDSMMPGVAFAPGDAVEVSAKISADGSATPRSGEPIGSVTYVVGRDGTRPLVIDGLSP
jgi:cytochrome c-type biogenesis protein CcmH